jgi:hypothetical protein
MSHRSASSIAGAPQPAHPHAGSDQWAATWERALPALAVAGPGIWFAAALVRAAGIGTLDGDLDWISRPEGFLMVLGVPFFVATFILLGRVIAQEAPRAGVAVTALGLLGIAPAGMLSSIRLSMGQFTDAGLDPKALNDAFETTSAWDLGLFLYSVSWFVAWIIAGTIILTSGIAPRWAGACCIAGIAGIVTAQALYLALPVSWPLGTGLLTVAVVTLARRSTAT